MCHECGKTASCFASQKTLALLASSSMPWRSVLASNASPAIMIGCGALSGRTHVCPASTQGFVFPRRQGWLQCSKQPFQAVANVEWDNNPPPCTTYAYDRLLEPARTLYPEDRETHNPLRQVSALTLEQTRMISSSRRASQS